MVIYRLVRRREAWVHPDHAWRREVSGTLFCRRCGRVHRTIHPHPIDAKLSEIPLGLSIGHVSGAMIGITHSRLLDRLAEHLTGFAFGDVYDEAGTKMEQYRTFYATHFIQPRGSADSDVGECATCGALLYIWKGHPYVLRHQLTSRRVYHDDICCTYIDEWLAARIDWHGFRDVKLYPCPVKDHPEDGWRLPGDPDWSAQDIPCRQFGAKRVKGMEDATDLGYWQLDDGGQSSSGCEPVPPVSPVLPPPLPAEQPMQFKFFAGPIADMAGFAGETKPCSLCGRQGPCFELSDAICPELPLGDREGKIGCCDCLRAGRFEFWHGTEIGMLHEQGLRSELTGELYLPEGFSEAALVELRRTPQIATNQEGRWLTHCHDFMAYQEVWNPSDFYEHAPDGDGRALFLAMTDPDQQSLWDDCWSDRSEPLGYWYATYYVFKCLHCGKLRGNWDVD